MALCYLNYYWFDTSKPPGENIEKAIELSQKTLALDANNGLAHGTLSQVYLQKRDYDEAIAEGEKAVSLDPGSPWTAFQYAKALVLYRKTGGSNSALGKSNPAQPPCPVALL